MAENAATNRKRSLKKKKAAIKADIAAAKKAKQV